MQNRLSITTCSCCENHHNSPLSTLNVHADMDELCKNGRLVRAIKTMCY